MSDVSINLNSFQVVIANRRLACRSWKYAQFSFEIVPRLKPYANA